MVNAPTPKYLLLGEKGFYQKFGFDVLEQAFKGGKKTEGENWGVEPMENWGKLYLSSETVPYPTINGDYRIFYQNVPDAISKGAPLKVTINQTVTVLKLIEASFLSNKLGRKILRPEGNW